MSPYLIPIVAAILFLILMVQSTIIYEHERGLLYNHGKFRKILMPGKHWYLRSIHKIQTVDIRPQVVSIPGQEILTSDNIGTKISLVGNFKVEDPYKAVSEVANYHQAIYLELQVNLRNIVGEIPIDDFLSRRQDISEQIYASSKEKIAEYGVSLEAVSIKDIMFPGSLKRVFTKVVSAKNEGLAALERARGESAALRKLANVAGLLEKTPGLLQLRTLQAIESNSGNTIILGDISEKASEVNLLDKERRQG